MTKYHGHANRMSRSVNPDYYRQAASRNIREQKRRIFLRAVLVLAGVAALSVLLFGVFTCDGCHSEQAMDKKPVVMEEKPDETPNEEQKKKHSSRKRANKEEPRESAYERALRNDKEPPETSIRIITD